MNTVFFKKIFSKSESNERLMLSTDTNFDDIVEKVKKLPEREGQSLL